MVANISIGSIEDPMHSISEVFREVDFEDAAAARQQRDLRLSQLQEQGLVCLGENLYHVEGWRVFTLDATPPPRLSSPVEALPASLPRPLSPDGMSDRDLTQPQPKSRPRRRAVAALENQTNAEGNQRVPLLKRRYEVR
jgi:hypothetical protein